MLEKRLVMQNATGLHARPAAQFVQLAAKYASKVRIAKEGKEVDAKSILSVLSLGVQKGATITIKVDGPDEEQALEHLIALIEGHFGEG
jgi:phosphocarrier protein HPr